MENLNRLSKAEEGGPIGRSRQQIWTLTQTGNWNKNKVDVNGDNDFIDANEVDEGRIHNNPNELTDRDIENDGDGQYDDINYDLTYNKVGQMTDDRKNDTYVFDGFGRLRKIKYRSNGNLVEGFWYDFRGRLESPHLVEVRYPRKHGWRCGCFFRERQEVPLCLWPPRSAGGSWLCTKKEEALTE